MVSMKERMRVINRIVNSEIASIKKKLFISIDIVTVIEKKLIPFIELKWEILLKLCFLN